MSMRTKIFLLLLPMMILVIALGCSLNVDYYSDWSSAQKLSDQVQKQKLISNIIHQFQIERAKSVLFATGKISKAELEPQRQEVDKLFLQAKNSFNDSSLVEKINEGIQATRKSIDEGNNPKVFTVLFKDHIAFLISQQVSLFERVHFNGMESKFSSLAIFEKAKENMGQLRARLNAVFGLNAPLTSKDLDSLSALRTGITSNLESPGLQLSQAGKDKVNSILTSKEWKDILEKYDIVIEKSTVGNYGVNSKDFSDAITLQINNVKEVINSEHSHFEDNLNQLVSKAKLSFGAATGILLVIVLLSSFFSYKFSTSLTAQLTRAIEELNHSTPQLTDSATSMSTLSSELSSCSTQQAAAIQETASSLEEIFGMITKNAENSTVAKDSSSHSLSSVNNGQSSVVNMLSAMENISKNNESFNDYIHKNNKDLEEIVKVIANISEKTKVINDIVFQTKLLSFNASVEAARAGEQGKGFAVVAEEVGNLAQMSGNAANEIKGLLDDSISKVTGIVSITKSQVDRLTNEGKESVHVGVVKAKECNVALGEIYSSVNKVGSLVTEVAHASKEQTKGVEEINKAMGQIDQVTHQNSLASQKVSGNAEQVMKLSHSIKSTSEKLWVIVHGKESA